MWLHLQMFFLHYIFKKALLNSYTLHNCFILRPKITLIRFHLHSFYVPFVVICCVTRCHSLSLVVIHCYALSFVVTRCHSLYYYRCHSLYYLLPLFFICYTAHCHSLPLTAIHRHVLPLDVPLVCLFINDHVLVIFILL